MKWWLQICCFSPPCWLSQWRKLNLIIFSKYLHHCSRVEQCERLPVHQTRDGRQDGSKHLAAHLLMGKKWGPPPTSTTSLTGSSVKRTRLVVPWAGLKLDLVPFLTSWFFILAKVLLQSSDWLHPDCTFPLKRPPVSRSCLRYLRSVLLLCFALPQGARPRPSCMGGILAPLGAHQKWQNKRIPSLSSPLVLACWSNLRDWCLPQPPFISLLCLSLIYENIKRENVWMLRGATKADRPPWGQISGIVGDPLNWQWLYSLCRLNPWWVSGWVSDGVGLEALTGFEGM